MKTIIALVIGAAISGNVLAKNENCKVNVNKASAAEIEACLDGFGAKKAEALVSARPFKSIEDLTRVSGVKDKTLEKIRNKVCLDDACVSGGAPTQAAPQASTAK